MSHDVFICHSSKDRTLATAICSYLEQNRIRCWIAPRDVVPGSDYAQSIVEAIARTRITLLVFSHSSNHSPHVKREIERSVSHGIPILPFRVEDVVPSPSLEYFISDAHWLDAITPPMEKHLTYLAGTLRMLLDRETAAEAGDEAASPSAAVPPDPAPAPVPIRSAEPTPPPVRPRWVMPAAIAGFVIVTAVVGVVIALGGGTEPAAEEPTMVSLTALKTGDCLATPAGHTQENTSYWGTMEVWPDPVPVVPCDSNHSAEVVFAGVVWSDATNPGQEALDARLEELCLSEFEAYVGIPYEQSRLVYEPLSWGLDEWPWDGGDRQGGCIAYYRDGQELEQSIKGLRQ